MANDKHRIVGIDEACIITRKAKPTIYSLARKGLIPAYKRGKKLYLYEDELLYREVIKNLFVLYKTAPLLDKIAVVRFLL